VPHIPQDFGVPLHESGAAPAPELAPDWAKTENFFCRRDDPQCGHAVPFQSEDRTKISLSC